MPRLAIHPYPLNHSLPPSIKSSDSTLQHRLTQNVIDRMLKPASVLDYIRRHPGRRLGGLKESLAERYIKNWQEHERHSEVYTGRGL